MSWQSRSASEASEPLARPLHASPDAYFGYDLTKKANQENSGCFGVVEEREGGREDCLSSHLRRFFAVLRLPKMGNLLRAQKAGNCFRTTAHDEDIIYIDGDK